MALQNLHVLEVTAESGRANPLIAALIEQLPAPGSPWSQAQRGAWLTMMETAFTVVYGAAADAPRSAAPRVQGRGPTAKRKAQAPAKAKAPPPAPGPAFFIDRQGFARRAGGARILPGDVAGMLVDKRGMNGDLGAIVWADDSTGIPKGLQLDIGIADGVD